MLKITHPLLSGLLPAPEADETPLHPVGTTFIRARPISSFRRDIPTVKTTGQPAFEMKYVDYSVFYPCSPHSESRGTTKWFPPHQRAMEDGFKKYLKLGYLSWTADVMGAVLGRVKFPAHQLAPLAPLRPESTGYPIIIFSHGLCGSRHTYSQYCSALAAKGFVVLSIEHRDGSGPAIMTPTDEGEELLLYVALDDLKWDETTDGSLKEMGEIQLDLRAREVYETYHHFCHLLDGVDDRTVQIGDSPHTSDDHREAFVESLKGKIKVDELYLSGHSFGGGTILHTLQSPLPADTNISKPPVKRCILLDPWIELVGDPSPSLSDEPPRVPMICINSPGFTAWTNNFGRLPEMIFRSDGTLVTLIGTGHMSFSDFALLKLKSTKTAVSLMRKVDSLVHAFLQDRLSENSLVRDAWEGQGRAETNEVKSEETGQIVIHLLSERARPKAKAG